MSVPGPSTVPVNAVYRDEVVTQDCGQPVADFQFPQPVRLTPAASGYLDAARAIAAIAVMMGHLRGLYFVEYGSVKAASPIVKALYGFTGFGHQAVMVFFVLSGLFISSSVLRKLGGNAWSWSDYAVDRGTRLWVVLIPGLVLGLLWDSLGIRFLNQDGIYSNPLTPFGDHIPVTTLAPAVFIGNLFFLQTRFTQVFGSNGPLWSLFNEFWYYVLFPALLALFFRVRRRAIAPAVGYLLLVVFTCWILGSQLSGFVVWLAGFGVALSARHLRFSARAHLIRRLYVGVTGAIFGISLLGARAGNPWFGSDTAVGLSCALLLHGILQLQVSIRGAGLHLAKTFAGFSFSLYVLHFPLLFLVRAKWLPRLRWQPDLLHLMYGACVCGGVLLYAYAVAKITESNTATVRAWVRKSIGLGEEA